MQTSITAIGTANPPYRVIQEPVMQVISDILHLPPKKARQFKSICKATEIDYRHSVLSDYTKRYGEFDFFPNDTSQPFPSTEKRMLVYEKTALSIALAAIADCFNQIPTVDKHSITHLITVSCTGMYAPGIDVDIVQHLNLPTTTKRTNIYFMGCYAAFNALRIADSICKADPQAKVLIVCVELCTLHLQNEDSLDNFFAASIFGDGAAAVLVEPDLCEFQTSRNSTQSNTTQNLNPIQPNPTQTKQTKRLSLCHFYSDILPDSKQEMAWRIGDFGFKMVLTSYVSQAIEFGIPEFARRLMNQKGMNLSDIDFYAIHPGGLKILKACEKALKINHEDNQHAYEVMRHHGNMSSATILFVLKRIWDTLSVKDHQKNIFSCAFGPGLTLESMLLQTHVHVEKREQLGEKDECYPQISNPFKIAALNSNF